MEEKQKSTRKEIEGTMACSAYAEAGEPCPIDGKRQDDEKRNDCRLTKSPAVKTQHRRKA